MGDGALQQSYRQFTSWAQLIQDEEYKSLVTNAELVEPLGELHAPDFGRCGLKGCNQPQKNSLLISLVGGGYTNIGYDCGATHFPEIWSKLKRKSKLYSRRAAAITSLEVFSERLPAIRTDFEHLQKRFGRAFVRMKSFESRSPPQLLGELARRASSGTPAIEEVTTSHFVNFFDTIAQTRIVGNLRGLGAFRPDRNFRAMFQRANEILISLETRVIARNSEDDVRKLANLRKQISRDADYLPSLLRTVERAGEDATAFFDQTNLDLLTYLQSASTTKVRKVVLNETTDSIEIIYRK